MAGRRRKAAFVLTTVWLTIIALHLVSWGIWLVYGFTSLAGMQILRSLLAKADPIPPALSDERLENVPKVSLLVAAKNEEIVISNL